MAVTCNKCGGSHPTWECQASDAKIAAFRKTIWDSAPAEGGGLSAPPQTATKARHQKKSTAALTEVQNDTASEPAIRAGSGDAGVGKSRGAARAKAAGTQAPPVDRKKAPKPKRGRPAKPAGEGFDKKAWQRAYMHEYRKGVRRKAVKP